MKNKNIGYVGLGLCLGVVFGVIFDNLAIGAGLSGVKNNNKEK